MEGFTCMWIDWLRSPGMPKPNMMYLIIFQHDKTQTGFCLIFRDVKGRRNTPPVFKCKNTVNGKHMLL